MNKIITEEMLNELNNLLATMGTSFRYRFASTYNGNTSIVRKLTSELFISCAMINVTDEFIKFLEEFFLDRGIVLSHNNTRDTHWSKYGWGDFEEVKF